MNETVTAARTAREKLSSALAALQSPEAGNLIDTVAEPVAAAMSALHRIETSDGAALASAGPEALAGVRRALEALQTVPVDNPVVGEATANVAGSLGLVFQLAQSASQASAATTDPPAAMHAAPQPVVPAQAPIPVAEPALAQAPLAQAPLAQQAPAPVAEPAPQHAQQVALAEPGPHAPAAHVPQQTAPVALAEPAPHPAAAQPAFAGAAAHAEDVAARRPDPLAQTQLAGTSPSVSEPPPRRVPSVPPEAPPDALHVDAALGAHSPTNFYKGLSGNDVLKDGGLFVATYKIPPIGRKLWVTVSLPGGYEFQAVAVVRWTRESGSGDAPPGFGAQFQEISSEARQLVYRYVRNREPLFHDDL